MACETILFRCDQRCEKTLLLFLWNGVDTEDFEHHHPAGMCDSDQLCDNADLQILQKTVV